MKDFNTNWTKEELKMYILIYCANADFSESKKEVDFIKSKVKSDKFDDLHEEFDEDNDFQSIEKIQASMEKNGYSKEDKDLLFSEIKELFLSDRKFDILEENMFLGLKHILK